MRSDLSVGPRHSVVYASRSVQPHKLQWFDKRLVHKLNPVTATEPPEKVRHLSLFQRDIWDPAFLNEVSKPSFKPTTADSDVWHIRRPSRYVGHTVRHHRSEQRPIWRTDQGHARAKPSVTAGRSNKLARLRP